MTERRGGDVNRRDDHLVLARSRRPHRVLQVVRNQDLRLYPEHARERDIGRRDRDQAGPVVRRVDAHQRAKVHRTGPGAAGQQAGAYQQADQTRSRVREGKVHVKLQRDGRHRNGIRAVAANRNTAAPDLGGAQSASVSKCAPLAATQAAGGMMSRKPHRRSWGEVSARVLAGWATSRGRLVIH